jgi:hypothetical protein
VKRWANGYASRAVRLATVGHATMNESTPLLALRPREAAAALNISVRHLWGLTAPRGPIPCIRVGSGKRRMTLYSVTALQAWLDRESAKKEGDR